MFVRDVNIINNRILIVDDTKSIHDDFKKILASKDNSDLSQLEMALFEETVSKEDENMIVYEIDDAYQGEEAVQKIIQAEASGRQYALVFMDVRMPPGMNGIEAIQKIWEINSDIEMVICTAYSDYSWEEILEKVGRTDKLLFLKKPFYTVEVKQMALSLVIKYNLNLMVRQLIANLEKEVEERTKQLHTVLEDLRRVNNNLIEKNRSLIEIAERDGLTGLYNQTSFYQKLDEIFVEHKLYSFPLSILMMDVDNFKQFNDNFGHQAGDQILIKVSELLRNDSSEEELGETGSSDQAPLRRYDIVGRYGGDEFAVILPYCGEDEAKQIAQKLNNKIKLIKFEENPELEFTVSIGIAVVDSKTSCESSKELVGIADKALYRSKMEGKNRYCVSRG